MNDQTEEEQAETPWIVFKLDKVQYAVNSNIVSSILILPENINEIPESPSYVRGLFNLRGMSIPLIDLRPIFELSTLSDEYEAFMDMLEARKQDHLNWVETLRECTSEGLPFPLATDPHKCAFGKWFYHYTAPNLVVEHTLSRIEEPHRRLHEMAKEMTSCLDSSTQNERTQCEVGIMKTLDEEILPTISNLIDETKVALKSSFQEMVLVISDGKNYAGIIVDEVLAVENLKTLDGQDNLFKFTPLQYVNGVSENSNGIVLMVDDELLLNMTMQ